MVSSCGKDWMLVGDTVVIIDEREMDFVRHVHTLVNNIELPNAQTYKLRKL